MAIAATIAAFSPLAARSDSSVSKADGSTLSTRTIQRPVVTLSGGTVSSPTRPSPCSRMIRAGGNPVSMAAWVAAFSRVVSQQQKEPLSVRQMLDDLLQGAAMRSERDEWPIAFERRSRQAVHRFPRCRLAWFSILRRFRGFRLGPGAGVEFADLRGRSGGETMSHGHIRRLPVWHPQPALCEASRGDEGWKPIPERDCRDGTGACSGARSAPEPGGTEAVGLSLGRPHFRAG